MLYFYGKDGKYSGWSAALKRRGVSCKAFSGRYHLFPVWCFLNILRERSSRNFIIVRYLNDSQSMWKSLIFLLSDFVLVTVSLLNSTKIVWFLHNVDEETYEFYPYFTSLRRRLILFRASVIYVMDPLLVEPSKKLLSQEVDVRWLTFGVMERISKHKIDNIFEDKIAEFVYKIKSENENCIVGLYASSYQKKNISLSLLVKNIQELESKNIYFVLIGADGYPEESRFLGKYKNFFLISENINLSPDFISRYFDFMYKTSTDQSVLLTAYVSSMAGIPVVTHNYGFFGKMVDAYDLGVVLDRDGCFSTDFEKKIFGWRAVSGDNFLVSHNWDVSAKQILEYIENENS